uniref:Uncharacterized protein n=1 Tax=Anguilla anguilla TaxID=7936 RepID=A0A0E9Y2E3_ANGAN
MSAWRSLTHLAEARASSNAVLRDSNFNCISFIGSNGHRDRASSTSDKSQEGMCF